MKLRQKKLRDQIIVITGATSGIGLATARLASARGARLVLASRNEKALETLTRQLRHRGPDAVHVVADVAERHAVERIAEAALERFGGFDTWVNNAGVMMVGKLMDVPLEEEHRLFDVNFWGVVHGSQVALPLLAKRGGTLINIGSVLSSRTPMPQGSDSAGKHAVKAFTDALRMEVAKGKLPVVVNLIKPASIDTPLPRHARNHLASEARLPAAYYAPEVVARTILHGARHKHRDVTAGGALIWLEKLAPPPADRLTRRAPAWQRTPPRPARDSLERPPRHELRTRGGHPGHVAGTSAYAALRLHFPRIAMAGLAVATAAAARRASGRRRPARPAAWLAAAALGALITARQAAARRREDTFFHGRGVIITGGSRGLGLVMARRFADRGARIALLARDEPTLRRAEAELKDTGAEVLALPCNVADPLAAARAVDTVASRFGAVDVLVNNAGIIQVGPLAHMERADFDEAMDTHFSGPLNMILAVLPHLRAAGGGRIVNISSIGGRLAAPHLVPYSASKSALTGLSEGLAAELRAENILVTTVIPGLMRTGSPPNARYKGRHHREYAWFAIADSLPLLSIGAGRAADKILRACRRGAPHLVVGVPAKAALILGQLFPATRSRLSALACRFLPQPDPRRSATSHSGWQSESRLAPSIFTRATYLAADRNNERPPPRRSNPPRENRRRE